MMFNFSLGSLIARGTFASSMLALGVVVNVALLAWFKYANWISLNLDKLGLWLGEPTSIILPLAISFFTFEQISYLYDCKHGKVKPASPLEYAFFVTFFPKLIAGPIVRFKELRSQIHTVHVSLATLAPGLTLFFIGLAKKLLVADYAANFVGPVFETAATGRAISTWDAWLASLAYTFQLYFDFSGYTDMAIGLGLIFGISLPINFYSPYKSTSIIEFWRRWHMTLSRFLRDYIYVPLGGSRRGNRRRYFNLILVMTIGGIWHGAGLTFLIWGALHGVYLAINHGFRMVKVPWVVIPFPLKLLSMVSGWALTFVAVVVGWVFFRAENASTAFHMLNSMYKIVEVTPIIHDQRSVVFVLVAMLALCLFAPNTNQIIGRSQIDPKLTRSSLFPENYTSSVLEWRPTKVWGVITGILVAIVLATLSNPSPFLYFNF
ncbi:MBOAT family O-acyltransferase [Thalassospira sp.]|uniref:MBOAT family O-acyltransferase n=1 Tax=Thalassospira sp. TaxID=1912094 RepID=UPI000C50F8F3|nr:MBOAT family O-acyltransferase [Thalassospira sp.]MBC08384.1 membrane-bound O-acyltransferase family protein [Thalassospira sp.]|tara:strand:- start:5258 stop:6559 length:1302 start_codon:yes stop_codon:yes gene_type:complete